MAGYLAKYRVLDLAERAPLAGRLLAQLGAEVVLIEPPGGAPGRREPPFDRQGGGSLFWETFAAGKRSVALDLDDPGCREKFLQLVQTADILFESETPGTMAACALDAAALRRVNPRLIHVSITPFGSDGPKAGWQESDITLWAAGGALFPSRDGSRPPLRISMPQAWLQAGADAAGAALTALWGRHQNGVGQHVDVSVQQSVAQCTLSSIVADQVGHADFSFLPRDKPAAGKPAPDLSGSGARTRQSKWELADGLVEMHLAMGPGAGDKTNHFFAWMRETGALPPSFWDWDWRSIQHRIEDGTVTDQEMTEARQAVTAFLKTRHKSEIVAQAMQRKILMAPLCTAADLLASPHHAQRHFFQRVTQGRRSYSLPGNFAQGMAAGFEPLTPAPAYGQDDDALLAPLPAPIFAMPSTPADAAVPPFAGLKVLDLAWVVAGPAIGRVLADYGAEVVRVESRKRVDTARLMGPFPGGTFDLERSALFETCNTGKYGLTLDLGCAPGQAVLRDLTGWADVVIESFAPGQMQRWGLGYEVLRAINPGVVLLSTSLMGQTGPYAGFAGYGNIGAAMAGFQNIVGWPDALPIGPFGPYTDYVGPRLGLVALLAALEHRRESGEGGWIDVSQAEAGMQFLSPQIADCSANGCLPQPLGNRDPGMAPHGVFPCQGEDRWVAIAVRDDAQWQILAELIGPVASDPQFVTLVGRQAQEDRLEAAVAAWTSRLAADQVESLLQRHGIAAHVVADSADISADAQLAARRHFVRLPHAQGGESIVEASRYRLSLTPARYARTAPYYGRDNALVLREFLGYDAARIEALRQAECLV